jgi:hypothetical protein
MFCKKRNVCGREYALSASLRCGQYFAIIRKDQGTEENDPVKATKGFMKNVFWEQSPKKTLVEEEGHCRVFILASEGLLVRI